MIEAVYHRRGHALLYRRPVGSAVVVFKEALIISTHMILIMTVKALEIGDAGSKEMEHWIPAFGFIDSLVISTIAAVILIHHVACRTPRGPVKARGACAGRVDVAAEAPPPQKIIYKHFRRLRIHRGSRFRQRLKGTTKPIYGWGRPLLCTPEEPSLVDNSGH
ncbi:MAG TPA: hypothetical protein VMW90_08205 [Acidobacteriota bacterium]|nr:hypothetical protein [Acidobacteriota bacterium]